MPPLLRLDADADAVMKSAQQIAREYDLDYVGTEHVLLAILRRNSSVGAKVLAEMGVSEARAREQIDDLIQKSKEDTWVLGRLPGTPHFKNVVTLAIEEAGQLESGSVGTGHLLLALLREQGCVADRALHNLGVRLKAAREKVVQHLSA